MRETDFWRDKRVLITGHTGFKGGWLTIWLQSLGARICGIGLSPDTSPSLFELANVSTDIEHHIQDIRDAERIDQIIQDFNPEIVFHLAAQPLVREGYKDPLGSFDTNVMGTVNVLEALRRCPRVKSIVVVTTDKVYDNLETGQSFKESDHLGGHDPYSASKAAAEIVVQCYRKSFFNEADVSLASARAGNVIGGGDWSEHRLIPDAIKAWTSGEALEIRSPASVRPWQHVLEPLHGYIVLAEKIFTCRELSGGWNFGSELMDAKPVKEVIEIARAVFGNSKVQYGRNDGPHEAGLLMLDSSKAKEILGIAPRWNLQVAIEKTFSWYQRVQYGENARELCLEQIALFEAHYACVS